MTVIINLNLFNLYIFKFNSMHHHGGILRNKYHKSVDSKISSSGMGYFFLHKTAKLRVGLGSLRLHLFPNYIVCDL